MGLHGKVPHLVTMHPRDVVVLVIDVIEQHDRVVPLYVHGQVAIILEVLLR